METEATQYPLLQALLWQGRKDRVLTETEELALYERNWRMAGVLATPSEEEKRHIRDLAIRHDSSLVCELS